MSKQFYFKQFSGAQVQFSSMWPIDRAISVATTLGQSEPVSDSKERVLRIPQSSSNTGTLPSDCLASYPGHFWGGSYLSAVGVFYSPSQLDINLHELFDAEDILVEAQ